VHAEPDPVIQLTVICRAEYVSVVRLAVLGICGRIPLTYDEVEDLRLAVGEACASAVERSCQADAANAHILMSVWVCSDRIVLDISDDVPLPPEPDDFRASLMQLLVDEMSVSETESGGQIVRLVKNCKLPA